MIDVKNVTKRYKIRSGFKYVLNNVSFSIPMGKNLGVLGRNGSGKSTLLRIIAGAEFPTSGKVLRYGTVSWPIGFTGGFQGSLTGVDTVKFISRIFGRDYHEIMQFVLDFSELGEYIRMPIASYSSGMRAKLGFGLSMAIDFNYYLIDEVTAVGDSAFRKKAHREFMRRKEKSTLVIVSHNVSTIMQYCEEVKVVTDGNVYSFDSLKEGLKAYKKLC